LLRLLQQREFCRLGSNTPLPLEARVVFATHRNLERMVVEGAFRQDLYFRINVLKIEAPPLRERPEDIPELARHFLRQYTPAGRPEPQILNSAMEMLLAYQWPGNVRELENVMQRAAILNEGYSISPADLLEPLRAAAELEETEFAASPAAGLSFEEQLREYKLRSVAKLAAQRLSITRAYLHLLLREQETQYPAERPALTSEP
jgi:DNA-binding NtrC family response regulator